jgi:hypothetical protein
MKRGFALVLAAAALAVAVYAATASAFGAGDVKGPACADIIDGGFSYNGSTVTGSVDLAAPACKAAKYTLVVEPQGGGTVITTGLGQPFGGGTLVQFSVPVTGGGSTVCLTVTSSLGGHIFDNAPDTDIGCMDVDSSGAGGSGFS